MKHRHKSSLLKNRLGLFIIIVAIIVLALIIIGSRTANSAVEINETEENKSVELQKEELEPVTTQTEETTTELEEAIKQTLSDKGMCEDYMFAQGDSLELKKHVIVVERMSSSSIRVSVDGEKFFLTEGDREIVNNLQVKLNEDGLHYFGTDDSENVAVLRIGCETSYEDPKDKYVREKGENICEEVYKQCKDSFGLN